MSLLQVLLRFDLKGKFVGYYDSVQDVQKGDIIAIYRKRTVIHYVYVYEVLQMHEKVPMCYHIHRISSGYERGLLYKQPLLTIIADNKTITDYDINRLSHSELRDIAKCEMFIDNQESYATSLKLKERSGDHQQKLHDILEAYYQSACVFDYDVCTTNCEHLATNWKYESDNPDKPEKAKAWSRQAKLITWYKRKRPVQNVKNVTVGSLLFPKLNDSTGDVILNAMKNQLNTHDFISRPTEKKKSSRKTNWLNRKLQDVDYCRDPSDYFTRDYGNRQLLEELRLGDLEKFSGTVLVLQSSKFKDGVSEYKRRQCYNPEHEIPVPGETTSYLRDIADIDDVVNLIKRNPQIKVFIWEKGFNCYLRTQWPATKYKTIGNALKKNCRNLEHISVMHYNDEAENLKLEQLFEPFVNSKNCMKLMCVDCPTIPLTIINGCSKLLNFLGTDISSQNADLINFAISELEVRKISSRFIAEKLIPEFVETLCKSGKKVTFLDVFAAYTREQTSKIVDNLTSLKHITVEGTPSDVMQDLHKIKKLNSLYWVVNFSSYFDDDPTSEVYGWPEVERHIALSTLATIGCKLTSLQIKLMPMDMEFFSEVLKLCPKLKVLRITLDSARGNEKGTKENRVMKFGPILETLKDTLTDLDLDGEWIDDGEHDLQQQLKDATQLRYVKVTSDLPTNDTNAIYNKIRFFCCFGLNENLEIIFEKFEEIERF